MSERPCPQQLRYDDIKNSLERHTSHEDGKQLLVNLLNDDDVAATSANAPKETIEDEPSLRALMNSRPEEFHQAVDYLRKIKERFSDRMEIYDELLEILARYEGNPIDTGTEDRQMSATEVYAAVSKLFDDEQDLMREFKSFLPDACFK